MMVNKSLVKYFINIIEKKMILCYYVDINEIFNCVTGRKYGFKIKNKGNSRFSC